MRKSRIKTAKQRDLIPLSDKFFLQVFNTKIEDLNDGIITTIQTEVQLRKKVGGISKVLYSLLSEVKKYDIEHYDLVVNHHKTHFNIYINFTYHD